MDNILVVDDERNIRTLVSRVLAQDQLEVHGAGTGKEGLQMADEVDPDVVLLDLRLPDMDGMDVLRTLKGRYPHVAVIIITGFGQIQSAVEAMRSGATDYLEKPFEHLEKLKLAVGRALEEVRARREIRRLHGLQEKQYRVDQLIGDSESTKSLRDLIGKLARSEAQTILIHGESGTGKELVARGLHYESARRDFPFMEVNCAAITETLFESELFGHEKGAFTDAKSAKKGLMELADRGTLFLDEVSEIPVPLQVKLLRFLQEREFERVGGNETLRVDVRIVVATNRDLEQLVKEGAFREDLFYRLKVPPLRARPSDVPLLAQHFLRRFAEENGKGVTSFSDDALRALLAYPWPGNVRELENAIERAVVLAQGDEITAEQLPGGSAGTNPNDMRLLVPGLTLAEIERLAITQALEAAGGSTSKAAQMLGISRRTIQYRLKEWGHHSDETDAD
jgi:two-component system response regulator AtoC